MAAGEYPDGDGSGGFLEVLLRHWSNPGSKVGADGAQGVPHLSSRGEALSITGGACLDKKLRKLGA
jgi:hypothetical protein